MKRIIVSYTPEAVMNKFHRRFLDHLAFNIAKWNGVFQCAGPFDSAYYDKVIRDLFKGWVPSLKEDTGKNGQYDFGGPMVGRKYVPYGTIQIVNIF